MPPLVANDVITMIFDVSHSSSSSQSVVGRIEVVGVALIVGTHPVGKSTSNLSQDCSFPSESGRLSTSATARNEERKC